MLRFARDALRTVIRRWRRNLLTVCAMAAGTAAAVALLGISQASAEQVVQRLQMYEATAITATLPQDAWNSSEIDTLARANKLAGVESAGTLIVPQGGGATITIEGEASGVVARSGLAVATEEGLSSRGVTFTAGSLPSPLVSENDPTLIVLGSALARELRVSTESGANRVRIHGRAATVVGIVDDGADSAALTATIVMSPVSAKYFGQLPPTRQINIKVSPGTADAVARLLPAALHPRGPGEVSLTIPPSPELLREQLTADATALVTVITAVTGGATLFGIITTMQISVWERRREIGLSRALGMSRSGIAKTFLWESIFVGAGGSLVGWILGILVTAVVVLASGWQLSLPPLTVAIPFFGLAVGALAGVVPARTASSISPAELLRS